MSIFDRVRSILRDPDQTRADHDWNTVAKFYQEHWRSDVDQRRHALDAFADLCSSLESLSRRTKFVEASIQWLEQVLSSDLDATCRVKAAHLLGLIGGTRSAPSDHLAIFALRLALYEDEEPEVRAECAKLLGEVGCYPDSPVGPLNVDLCRSVQKTLLRAYQTESDERVRPDLFVALTGFDGIGEGTETFVQAALNDANVEVREHAHYLVEKSQEDAAEQAAAADAATRHG